MGDVSYLCYVPSIVGLRLIPNGREAGVPRLSGRESTLSVEAVEIETKEPVGNGAQS